MYHINKEITGSGENIALKNTARHYYKDFGIFGNSKQETRKGYNKFDASLITTKDDSENSGVVLTNNGDGSFTIKSTETVAKMFTMTATYSTEVARKLFKAGTVYIKQDKTNVSPYPFLSFRHASGTYGEVSYSSNNTKFELTQEMIDSEGFYVRFGFYAATNATGTSYTCKPMVYQEGDGTFELFGASPSIEFKAPIESVGDNIQLFDKDNVSTLNGYIDNNGYFQYNTSNKITYIECKKNENYTVSSKHLRGLGFLNEIPKTGLTSTNFKIQNTTELKLNSGENSYLAIWYYDTSATLTEQEILDSIKIVEGTSTGPYSPYGQGSIEIYNCNENWFDKNKVSTAIDGVSGYVSTNYIPAKIGDKVTKSNATTLYFYNSSKTLIQGVSNWKTGTIVIENTAYIRSNVLETELDTFMLVKNQDLPSEYIQGKSQTKALYTQQPFRAIGDVKDRFVKQDGVWYEEHNIARKIFDGTEEWITAVIDDNYARFYIKINDKRDSGGKKTELKSNMFISRTFDEVYKQELEGVSEYIGTNTSYYKNVYIKLLNTNISSTETATLTLFKAKLTELYNAGTPLYVDYQLATPTLIECTAEQVEQLEYFEKEAYSYDEVTHIYSTDEVSPHFEVTAYQRISEEFKTRLKEGKITRGYLKVLANDIYPEIVIDENNYLKDLKIEELRYVPEEGFIGGTVAKRVSGNFNNVESSFNIQDREIEVYLGVELEDETTEYINFGTYIVQRPEDNQVNDNTSFEALDYMIKFNLEYEDRVTYPCTLKELFDDIVDQAGVTAKVTTFPNADFIVEDNQFETGTTLRDVLKAITQMAFNWSRIDQDDNLVMDFEIKDTVDETLEPDDYFNYTKSDYYGPINTLILRNSQVEGENITIKDEELINSPKGYNLINTKYNVDIRANDPYTIKVEPNTYYLLTLKQICIALGTSTRSQHWYKIFDKYGNILKQSSIIPFDFTEVNEIKSGKQALLMPENADYITIDLGSYNSTAANTLRHLEAQFIKGQEEKPYQPYIPLGEIEYVISDNPFAYTEAKRAELIEAGRKLFGLKYTPMSMDMIGFMYLNATDRIAATNLNGETFYTYLLNHTIDYTGVVLDSMESPAKTKTETKYQFTPQMIQLLKHTEIKVDKANQEISLVAEKQEGLESTVAEQKISLEEIRTGLTKVEEVVERTVARVEVVYALSDSPTEAPTDGWSTTAPEWVEGKYMWQKTITTYSDGTSAETAATNISGAQGKDGISGINGANSYSYVAFANSADGSVDFSRTDSTDKTYIGTLTINESVNENLLKKTNQGTTHWGYATQNGSVTKEAYEPDGANGVKLTCTVASTGWQYASFYINTATLNRLKESTNYVVSFDIQTDTGAGSVGVALKQGNGTNIIANEVKSDISGDETWEHFSIQLKTIADFSNITIGSQVVFITGVNKVGYYIIKNLKLEEGYKETSYSKSPEDLADDYTQYYWQYTKGEEGVGVKAVVDQYYLSTSNTEQTGGEWQETQPQWEEGNYIWTRTKITWTNDSITYTDPILANTLNDINSNIIVLKEFNSQQVITNQGITSSVSEVTKRLNNDYLTAEQVNAKVDGLDDQYEALEERVASTELSSSDFKVRIETIENNGVDKITTSMGYTFNDSGLNINRDNADTGTIVDEAGIQVIDKTGSSETDILYAGYVKEDNTKYADYVGQTIVATSNLIVKTYLVIGSNSRFQDYENPTLGGQGTGAFDI